MCNHFLSSSLSLPSSPLPLNSLMAHHHHTRSSVYHKRNQEVIDGSEQQQPSQTHHHHHPHHERHHSSVLKKLTVDLIKTYRNINEVWSQYNTHIHIHNTCTYTHIIHNACITCNYMHITYILTNSYSICAQFVYTHPRTDSRDLLTLDKDFIAIMCANECLMKTHTLKPYVCTLLVLVHSIMCIRCALYVIV